MSLAHRGIGTRFSCVLAVAATMSTKASARMLPPQFVGIWDPEHSSNDMKYFDSSTVSVTVLSLKPVKFGRIFALASVAVDIHGVLLVLHGVRVIRAQPMETQVDLPVFRDENDVWNRAITLPDEICAAVGKAVHEDLVERGLAVRGPVP
jgi:hypothetical protein